MPRNKTPSERAAGKLIAAIQKEWHEQLGDPTSNVSEQAMNNAHDLLAASKDGPAITALLAGRTVTEFIGTLWVKTHPSVIPAIRALEAAISESAHA